MGCGPLKVSPIIPSTNNPIVGIDRQSALINENQDFGNLREEFSNYEKIIKNISDILEIYKDGENKSIMKISYEELNNICDDQKYRMNKNGYEVAIVGLEKAGKSTLINSWIGWNLLTSEANSC